MIRIIKPLILAFFFLLTGNLVAQQSQLSKKDTSEVRFLNSRKFWIYKVDKGETLFSISQKFKIPQEEILEFNSDLAQQGLKAKMKLWVPAYSWLNKKDTIKTPTEDKLEEADIMKKNLNILFLSALNFHKQYSGGATDDSSFVKEPIAEDTRQNLEFLEGALIASRDFSEKSNRISILIRDTEGDSMTIRRLLLKQDVGSIDAIITNESGSGLRAINNFSMMNNIPLFSGGIKSTDFIRNNPHAYALSPSSLLQCELMGRFSSAFFKNSNCLLLRTGISKEDERAAAFKSGWMDDTKAGSVRKVNFSGGYSKALKDSLHKSKMNVLFVPSSNEDIIISLLTSLKSITKEYKISVIGLPTWLYSQSIDPALFDTCDTYLFSSGYIDFAKPEVTEFRRKFRDHYHSEPTESAFFGYDALQLIVEKFSNSEKYKKKDKKRTTYEGLYSRYRFLVTDDGKCKENQVIQFYKFEESIPVHFKMDDSVN